MRYQKVEDIESLHVDDTGPILEDSRTKSFLDPIILREAFYDPRIPINQRTLYIGAAVLIGCIGLATLGIVLLGATRVMKNMDDETNKYGLQLIPDLHEISGGVLRYSKSLNMNSTRAKYIKELDDFLDIYVKEQESRRLETANCTEGQRIDNKWCSFDVLEAFKREGRGCTRADGYGYESGSPCMLFAFRDEIQWKPKVASNVTELPFKCEIKTSRASSKPAAAFYFPPMKSNLRMGGFPLNKVPSVVVRDNRGSEITDEDGEILYDLPPLIFVKFSLPEAEMHYKVACQVLSRVYGNEVANMEEFTGRRTFTFEIHVN